jgi:hypothetical protein
MQWRAKCSGSFSQICFLNFSQILLIGAADSVKLYYPEQTLGLADYRKMYLHSQLSSK